MEINELSGIVLDVCIKIHRKLGPGLLESVYESILFDELQKRNLSVERQKPYKVFWDDREVGIGFRADLVLENKIIIELKSVGALAPVHFRQVQTYLKISGLRLGLLINFNEKQVVKGFRRVVQNF